ncbi:putative LPS assembly protein LptD [Draconibacterium sp. IB214405]|uniref:putative LPS assembly protein LptD n=1 Tax=Draconibacterium sp. IB214405 TaxID=3097352 RepID=UPI002A12AE51|nr:putative LPS assembly protein LptD [Draconibacterium sp. IB214405]MDX8339439.1 putative LPS assembly protein LptD [Draconibacterium sp. IB214405]
MYKIIITYLFLVLPFLIFAQEPEISIAPQQQFADTTFSQFTVAPDTVLTDNVAMDSMVGVKEEKAVIDEPIDYTAKDSMIVSLDGQKVYLYNEAKVTYQNIELEAYYIELDLETKEIYAEGTLDSVGEMTQKPLFKQGSEEYESETMRYNFETEKAFITKVVSAQGEGFIHSDRTKKIGEEVFITKDAKYTTCDADHPHFYLHLTKAKVISNEKIITGPAYMVLEDFPIYFPILPFGYFPNSPSYSSGILIPTYGEEQNRGFFLRDGGYYWAASQYFDLAVQGDIYSRGSWGTRIKTNYKKRYKFSGNFGFDYAINKYGEQGLDTYSKSKQYKIMWSHTQDSKANPNQTFSASVNMSSSGYDKQNAYDMNEYLTTTKSSSISYSRKFENTPFNMSMNLRHSQNTKDSTMSLSLPEMTFSMAKIYPFRKKNRSGKIKFYEKFGINYTGNLKNSISAKEDEIFQSSFATDWKNGIKHNIPISFPSFNLFNHVNFSPGISYNEKWYFKKYNYNYEAGGEYTGNPSAIPDNVRIDTITGLNRVYDYAYSISASTNIYGTYQPLNPNSKIKAIRHKMTPSVSFSYKPDFGAEHYGYWQEVQIDEDGNTGYYDTNLGGIYGGSPGRGETGAISFSLNNNLEMKKLDTRDSTKTDEEQKYKKVKIIDNLSIASSYNLIADSLNLSPFSIRARTTVAGVSINMGTTLDPYMLDENYRKIHKYTWNERNGIGKLGRVTRANLSFGMNFNSKDKKDEDNKKGGETEGTSVPGMPEKTLPAIYDEYIDFSIPWDFGFDYSLNYTGATSAYPNGRVTQTLGLRGNVSITEKWKLSAMTNFDIQEQEFALTSFRLNRDLHCWNMSFNFVPFGYRKSYSFTISASSSMLSDLKIQKQQSHYDNFSF